jgi:quercetin dioxygenase-like cupin family protein
MDQPIIEDPVLRQRYRFGRWVDEDGADVLDVETWVDPGGGVTPHVHPAMEERFEIMAGRPSFLAGRSWRPAGPGDTVVVPAGTRHAYRNDGDDVAHVVCHVRPPSSLQEFLEEIAALSRAGGLMRGGLPKSPRALVAAAAVIERHRDMVELGFPPLPPARVQRLLFPRLARLGERRGIGARRAAHG